MSLMGMNYLKNKLSLKKSRVETRYKYYEMKNGVKYIRGTIPSSFAWMSETLGWCAKATDSLADRLIFSEFEDDDFDINEIFFMNNADILFDSASLSALIASCSFIYVYKEDGEPKLQVIDSTNATGIIDSTTCMLKEGYAELEHDSRNRVITEAYFTGEYTYFYSKANGEVKRVENLAPYP